MVSDRSSGDHGAAPAAAASGAGGVGVMDRLKERTREHHVRAETKRFQKSLVKGELSRDAYARWLCQMLLVHDALEREIGLRRGDVPALRVVTEEQSHSYRLRDDCLFYGLRPVGEAGALPATRDVLGFIRRTGAERPVALLGLHYVLEGSMNGNRYIAHAVRRSFGLTPGQGDRYLDPYGEAQRAKWAGFRAAVDAMGFSESEMESMVEAAQRMFDGIAEMSDQMVGAAEAS